MACKPARGTIARILRLYGWGVPAHVAAGMVVPHGLSRQHRLRAFVCDRPSRRAEAMSILILIAVVGGGLLTSVLALAATVVFVLKLQKPRAQKTGVA